MAGLPKSYIKKYGISKRAWTEYRKAKRGGRKSPARKTATRKTSRAMVSRKTAPARTKRKIVTRATAKNVMDKTTANALKIGSGVGGAVGTAMLIKMLPFGKTGQAFTQLLSGLGMMALIPKKRRIIRYAGYGSALAGGLAVLKTTFPDVPLLAGNNKAYPRRVSYYNQGRKPAETVNRNGTISTTYLPMGENKNFSMAGNKNFAISGKMGGYGVFPNNPYQ